MRLNDLAVVAYVSSMWGCGGRYELVYVYRFSLASHRMISLVDVSAEHVCKRMMVVFNFFLNTYLQSCCIDELFV